MPSPLIREISYLANWISSVGVEVSSFWSR
jgi:hypothetical protein